MEIIWRVYVYKTDIWIMKTVGLFTLALYMYTHIHIYTYICVCVCNVCPQAFQWYLKGNGPLARYVKLRVAHSPGMFPHHQLHIKPLINDPSMHHGTCVTHVPWCMSGLLIRGGGESVPGIPLRMHNANFYVSGKRPISHGVETTVLVSYVM